MDNYQYLKHFTGEAMRIKTLLTALFITIALGGCIVVQAPPPAPQSYPVVGRFNDLNEVFYGRIYEKSTAGESVIELRGNVTGMKCYGSSFATQVPNFANNCEGLAGKANVSCDDGRLIEGKWAAIECRKGVASGKDQNGNMLTFVYGMNDSEAQIIFDKVARQASSLPSVPPVYQPKETRKEKGFSTGSGFFVSEDGYLITNYHVIQDATSIAVATSTEDILKASLMKSDPANDLALLKVNYHSQPLAIGSSTISAKADDVFTLGYPLIEIQGQEQKANFGRINALSGFENDIRYMQIDVPIQPGNSGGPLFNAHGEVIGIVSATLNQLLTLQQSGSIPQNVGYAVKADYAIPLLQVSLGDKWKKTERNLANTSLTELVRQSGQSVVLVIAK